MILFDKDYCGESICDMDRDIHEALDGQFNDKMNAIPVDEYGFSQGTFSVTIEWKPCNEENTGE